MAAELYRQVNGWCHDCKVWYFPNLERPKNLEIGDEITLELIDQLSGVGSETATRVALKGTMTRREEYDSWQNIYCTVIHNHEQLMAVITLAKQPNEMDSVRFMPMQNVL